MTANDLLADGAPANELPIVGTAFHDGLTAQHDSVEEECGQVSNMAHTTRKAFSTPMNRPAWGPVTNIKRLNLAKAFQAKVWVPQKRNQILRNVPHYPNCLHYSGCPR
jgi:hypothetical protein